MLAQKLVLQPLPLELGLGISIATQPWASKPLFFQGGGSLKEQENLVWEFIRRAEKVESDVRLDIGFPFRPKAWPRAGLRADLWAWRVAHGYPWKALSHINHLELLAVLNTFKWKLRSVANFGKRFLHLVDSQVVASILTRGRTSSQLLRNTVRRVNALVLSCGIFSLLRFSQF